MTNTKVEFEKMVKADKFRFVANLVEDAEVREFLEVEASRVEAKNAKRSSKPTKAQQENEAVRDKVRALFADLAEGTVLTADEVMSAVGCDKFSPQKATAVMKPLLADGFEKVDGVEVVVPDGENVKKSKKVGYKVA